MKSPPSIPQGVREPSPAANTPMPGAKTPMPGAKTPMPGATTPMPGATTPMMEQFWRAKREQPGALLFFRMGDFYELFHDDAHTVSRELGIALTSRSKGEGAIAMAGVPVRSSESYLQRLVQKGFKVAICEQLEDPRRAKGIVDRGIVRVVTAGTLTEEDLLDSRDHNYLAAVHASESTAGVAWVDLSTGRFSACVTTIDGLTEELAQIAPAEILLSSSLASRAPQVDGALRAEFGPRITERDPWCFDRDSTSRALMRHFKVATLEGFGVDETSPVVPASGALLAYLEETQRCACDHIRRIELVDQAKHLVLDRATRACLEITLTQREGRREGSLLDTIDATATPMGGRLLKDWLSRPLRDVGEILTRQRAVAELLDAPFLRQDVRDRCARVQDIERLAAKVSTNRAHARDLVALGQSLAVAAELRPHIAGAYSTMLAGLAPALGTHEALIARIRATLIDQPPLTTREGGLIRDGFSKELDELRSIATDAKSWMARLQADEIARTGINGLKVGFNSVFGYFIEVPRSQADRVPPNFIRKQTVKSAERYITPELKEFETKVLHAEELGCDLELTIFEELRAHVAEQLTEVLATASAVAQVDVLAALAQRAAEFHYVAPAIDDGEAIRIVEGRHPVVERRSKAGAFVPNDCTLDLSERLITVITGPNMAGKSTYIRQSALIVLLAQIGSFVPASEARIGVVDRIFTRLGSADDIGRDSSTFMVEMVEIANILNNASSRSLVLLDEVGRGTSTFDGLALAWAIVEHLHEHIRARTLFATHYHQLTDLAERFRGVHNMNVSVRDWNDEIIFLHKIVDGGTDRSYGIHVARLAGVPADVIARASKILADIEASSANLAPRIDARGSEARANRNPAGSQQLSLFAPQPTAVEAMLEQLDPDRMTPIDALLALRDLKRASNPPTER